MATSGTYTSVAEFNIAQVVDESFRRCRIDPSFLTADHTLSARISLDFLFIEWANAGVEQFMIDQQTLLLDITTELSFVTPPGTIDILDMVFRDQNNNDIQIKAISRRDYLYINDKQVLGQPVCYFVDKTTIPPTIFLWSVQNIPATYVVYNRLRQMQDVGSPINTPDCTVLYKDAMCAGLATRLYGKYVTATEDPNGVLGQRLMQEYARAWELAREQDRERAAYIIKPRIGRRFRSIT